MSTPTVLIVDDHDDIRELTQLVLTRFADWNVVAAGGGLAGIDMARPHQPDAVLLDMSMPDLDELATFDRLQDDESTSAIPVILFTAGHDPRTPEPWAGYALTGVIHKPYDPKTLANQVAEILGWGVQPRSRLV